MHARALPTVEVRLIRYKKLNYPIGVFAYVWRPFPAGEHHEDHSGTIFLASRRTG